MSQHRFSLAALFEDRSIATKISLGFACVLAILAIASSQAYFSFQSSADGFTTYAQRVMVVGIARDLDRSFLNLRRFVREYAYTGVESNIDSARQEAVTVRGLLRQGLTASKNPDRHQRIEHIASLTDSYLADFDKVVAQTQDLTKLEQGSLDPQGLAQREHFDALIAATANGGDTTVTVLANKGLEQFMAARLGVNKALGRHDVALAEAAEKTFSELATTLQGLDPATKDAAYRKDFEELRAGVPAYHDTFHKVLALRGEIAGLVNGTMTGLAGQVQTEAEAIKASGIDDEMNEERATLANMDHTATMLVALSAGGMLLGAVLAWLIGRGIAGPVVRLCTAMRALAAGDKTIAIPGVGRRDEVGQMAGTVQVFKNTMIEAELQRAAHDQQKAALEAERKAGMLSLADTFESGIKGVVQIVASQATEMQSAATTLASAAQQASHQATAVAAAVEQASANVQSVASSAEELSSSVLEIGRQMEQSSKIAHQAVDEAARTNTVVEGLSKTAQRIGEVVQLIQTIANQTNLLALNATIEAARAGDAGKGFAVVASEVKSLANQTAKATSDIKTQIDDIQSATGQTVDAIRRIGDTIGQMNEIAATIASAVEEQGAATREIAANVQQAAQGTSEIASNIEGVGRAASDTGAAATQLLGAAGDLSRQSATLRHDVDEFLVSVRAA